MFFGLDKCTVIQFLFFCIEKIDPAIASVRNDLITSGQLTQSYGLSFLVGGVQTILGDFLGMWTHIIGVYLYVCTFLYV